MSLGWDLRGCICNKPPGEAGAAGPRTTLGEPLAWGPFNVSQGHSGQDPRADASRRQAGWLPDGPWMLGDAQVALRSL